MLKFQDGLKIFIILIRGCWCALCDCTAVAGSGRMFAVNGVDAPGGDFDERLNALNLAAKISGMGSFARLLLK